MPVPEIIHQLVERFEENRAAYRSGKYNETQLRLEFLDPFFEALGWDMYNKKGYAPDYRDVIHEDSIEIENVAKAPDYAFKIGKERKFFVEAKKPAVNIEFDIHPAYQLRRYAWNVRLPLSILTDFEEFAVYDCRNKPDHRDSAAAGRVLFFTYRQYLEKWDEIAAIFSRQSVLKGSFDQYAAGVKGKKGTLEVDDAFLSEIERWRDLLARNLALRNPAIANEHQLNYAVQMTIDRIIFLRICEDRGIEPEDQLRLAARTPAVYAELVRLFKRADMKYNSGLFHFSDESGQVSAADTFTPCLKIDDKVLKDILTSLYFPCPYIFKEIPVEILGQVYERFLGKVIRLTAGHQAKVEEKPEVRKAGGVYYTPTYIVSYIVQNTVGKLLEGITPDQASNLKLLDPACGSGSFLLGAYQYLLDWHLSWYSGHEPEKWARGKRPAVWQAQGDDWRLTTAEKKRILLNNNFGVDIDPQAVEVTKLSLLLKVLEGETGQLSLGLERVLPDLGHNIQCGNSLIGPDYYEGRQLTLGMLDEQERYHINAFDWQVAFPQVFAAGGFDVAIGNPPYIRMETFKELKEYLKANYDCHDERSDIYAYFIERAHKILKVGGQFGMIVSNKFLRANYGKPLRDFIQQNASVNRIVDFAGLPVFKGATVRTIVFLSSRGNQKETLLYTPPIPSDLFSKVELDLCTVEDSIAEETYEVSSTTLLRNQWSFAKQDADDFLNRLKVGTSPLYEYCNGLICMGIKSGLSEAFMIDAETRSKILQANPETAEIIKPFINGRDIRRYALEPKNIFLIYAYHGVNISEYSSLENHLKPFKERLIKRATKQEWYELQQPQYAYVKYFESPKIVFPDIAITPRFVLDENCFYGSNTMYFIPKRDLYLLGLLNSKLAYFYFRTVCAGLEGKNITYLRFFGQYLENFPVILPLKNAHDRMVSLVERMLALHKQTAQTPQEQEMLQREIAATDAHIDRLVYELYGLTEDEIRIVEGK